MNFSKLVSLLVSDSVPNKDRDSLEDILPNKMIRKINLIISLNVVMKFLISQYRKLDT